MSAAGPPYTARIEIAIYAASAGGLYWGRYPNGDRPMMLAAHAGTPSLAAQARATGVMPLKADPLAPKARLLRRRAV